MRDKSRHNYRHSGTEFRRPLGVWGISDRSCDRYPAEPSVERKPLWFTDVWSALSTARSSFSAFCARFRHNERHNADTVADAYFLARVGLMYCAAEAVVAIVALVVIALAGAP